MLQIKNKVATTKTLPKVCPNNVNIPKFLKNSIELSSINNLVFGSGYKNQ